MNIKFDLVIANPPYGSLGANITKNIIDNIDFNEYINLLPANDYKRNTEKNLFQYAREMENINDGFKDAMVTTHLCKIAKNAISITLDQFEISNYIDRSLDRYFTETRNRSHYAFDKNTSTNTKLELFETTNNNVSYIQGAKDVNHKHLPYSKDCVQYKWNVEKSIDSEYIKNNCECNKDGKPCGATSLYLTRFNSTAERDNFVKFIYSKDGFRFISKVFTAVNVDSYTTFNKFMPKVDWTRSWTVEEILKDYGYTDLEIENIMNDLKNFRGMDD